MEFSQPKPNQFPSIGILQHLSKNLYSTPIIINGANEILVELFLQKKIKYNQITQCLFALLKDKKYKKYAIQVPKNLNDIIKIDKWSRVFVMNRYGVKWLKIYYQACLFAIIHIEFNSWSVKILIEGNKRIDPETIKIYGEVGDKDDYTNQDINNILKNLYDTDFFEDINITFENKILKINVKEYPVISKLEFEGEPANKIVKSIKERIFQVSMAHLLKVEYQKMWTRYKMDTNS